jgi:hypothetical protein
MIPNRVALALARRYGNTAAWRAALRIVDSAHSQLGEVWSFLYAHDQQRIAREAVRDREKEEAGRQALAELDALIARLKREAAEGAEAVVPAPAATNRTDAGNEPKDGTPEDDVARLMALGRALGKNLLDDIRLRAATGKAGRS